LRKCVESMRMGIRAVAGSLFTTMERIFGYCDERFCRS
jgi:hypothetical protein